MKIRRSILRFCVAVAVLMVLVIWFSRRSEKTTQAGRSVSESTNAAPGTVTTQEAPVPMINPTGATAALSSAPPVITKSKEQQMYEILSTENDVPIIFYGKLEDQFERPIGGAEVTGNTIIYNGVTQ